MSEVRLIDANALKDGAYINKGNFNTVEGIREWIDNAPTVDYTFEEAFQKTVCEQKLYCPSRQQGEWKVNNYGEHICPKCGHYALYDEEQDNEYYEVQSNFCPECGADLRGGAK